MPDRRRQEANCLRVLAFIELLLAAVLAHHVVPGKRQLLLMVYAKKACFSPKSYSHGQRMSNLWAHTGRES
jgi:hypothetical protein